MLYHEEELSDVIKHKSTLTVNSRTHRFANSNSLPIARLPLTQSLHGHEHCT
jgi:hypothetical protein